jgi:hypothetical protein
MLRRLFATLLDEYEWDEADDVDLDANDNGVSSLDRPEPGVAKVKLWGLVRLCPKIWASDGEANSTIGCLPFMRAVLSVTITDPLSLGISASGTPDMTGDSIDSGVILPLTSGATNISLTGELKCGVLSTLELWISPRSCALCLLFLPSVLKAGLDASLAPDSDPEVG